MYDFLYVHFMCSVPVEEMSNDSIRFVVKFQQLDQIIDIKANLINWNCHSQANGIPHSLILLSSWGGHLLLRVLQWPLGDS
jgi:hypothetical protein